MAAALLAGAAIGVLLGATGVLQALIFIPEDSNTPSGAVSEYSHVLGVVESASATEVSIQRCDFIHSGKSVTFLLDAQRTECDVELTVGKHVYITYRYSYQNEQLNEGCAAFRIEDAEPYL